MNKKELCKILVQHEIKKAIKYFGIELTEEKIKFVYKRMPYLKWYMLREYYNITGRSDQYKQMEK